MKKIFTLIAVAAATLSMSASDFQLYFKDAPVVDGATYQAGYELTGEEQDYADPSIIYYTWTQDSYLYLHGTPGISVTATVTTDAPISWCGLAQSCADMKAGDTLTRTANLVKDGQTLHLDNTDTNEDSTTWEVIPDKTTPDFQTVNVTVTAQETGDEASKVTVYVTLLPIPDDQVTNSISSVALDGQFVKAVAGNTISYNVAGTQTLALYSITGRIVGRYQISGNGTLNLSSLPSGIYIYTDGQHKGKMIIR
ncbi:MAG: T9SS type A sorting domain-containing protein [Bacteroidales bacterium]|nr:T9SS type A sorting domain-containing protein [Bacteroidales bacterium]